MNRREQYLSEMINESLDLFITEDEFDGDMLDALGEQVYANFGEVLDTIKVHSGIWDFTYDKTNYFYDSCSKEVLEK